MLYPAHSLVKPIFVIKNKSQILFPQALKKFSSEYVVVRNYNYTHWTVEIKNDVIKITYSNHFVVIGKILDMSNSAAVLSYKIKQLIAA